MLANLRPNAGGTARQFPTAVTSTFCLCGSRSKERKTSRSGASAVVFSTSMNTARRGPAVTGDASGAVSSALSARAGRFRERPVVVERFSALFSLLTAARLRSGSAPTDLPFLLTPLAIYQVGNVGN